MFTQPSSGRASRPLTDTVLGVGALLIGVAAPLHASTQISSGGLHIPTVSNFCGQDQLILEATICNTTADAASWELSFFDGGTPPAYSCTESIVPDHTFLDPATVTVGPFQCKTVRIAIARPPELDVHASVCYWIQFVAESGGTAGLGAQFIDSIAGCIDWHFEEQVLWMHPLDPVVIDPSIVNHTTEVLVFDYFVEVRGEDNTVGHDVVSLNGATPGKPLEGSVDVLPGESARIPLTAEWLDPDRQEFFDIVIMGHLQNPGRFGQTRGQIGDIGSIALGNADQLVAVGDPDVAPDIVSRLAVSPNPWPAGRVLTMSVGVPDWTSLTVLDASGRAVHRILPGGIGTSETSVSWDGVTGRGTRVPPGAYFIRLDSSRGATVSRFVVLP